MAQENLNQNFEKRTQVKVRSSRDTKWLIFRIDGLATPVFLSVNYLKVIIDNALKRRNQMAVNVEQIKN